MSDFDWSPWAAALLALLGTGLAVWKDTRVEDAGTGHKRITIFGRCALVLAAFAFLLAGYDALRERQQRRERAIREQEIENRDKEVAAIVARIQDQVEKQLPGWIQETLMESQDELQRFVEGTNTNLRGQLANTIATSGEGLEKQITARVANTEKALTDAVKSTTDQVGTRIAGTVATSLGEAQKKIDKTILQQTESAATATIEAVKNAAVDTIARTEGLVFAGVADIVTQVPIAVMDESERRLPGVLSMFRIKVGDISATRKFAVRVVNDANEAVMIRDEHGRELAEVILDPKAKEAGRPHVIRLPYQDREYQIEMTVNSPSNWFGGAPDTLLCHVVLLPPA